MDDLDYMKMALAEALAAAERDEVPIGAVIVHGGEVIARNGNRTREMNDPTAHAEILVIRAACAEAGAQRIPDCDLYVTLEPCGQCAAAISFARIRRLIFAACDPKGGGVLHGPRFYDQPTCHHRPEVVQMTNAPEAGALLKSFFAGKRK
ncbi:MAG TPA: nucleoside deaminase [Patescibacteria group bacterium]|jgi:tRNA(adenine34) deaminase|nr:nucleoside deaminase [Patescibacteria group bacterium]